VLVKHAGLTRGQELFINGATGAVGHAAIAIVREIGAEMTGRVGPQSIAQSQSLRLSLALDYTKPLSPALDGSFDVVFDANESLAVQKGRDHKGKRRKPSACSRSRGGRQACNACRSNRLLGSGLSAAGVVGARQTPQRKSRHRVSQWAMNRIPPDTELELRRSELESDNSRIAAAGSL